MRRVLHLFAAVALLGGSVCPAGAVIQGRVEDGKIIITNLPDKRAIMKSLPTHPVVARSSGSAAAPVTPPTIAGYIQASAARYGFDPQLISSIVAAESAFDRMAVSKKGARGLMQLMPDTAREYGVSDLHDVRANLEAGVIYLRELVSRFGGDVKLALAAYNAGPDAVARYGGVPPYEETRKYLETIRSYYGSDLNAGDWSSRRSGIHIVGVDAQGVPEFTNLPSRRLVVERAAKKASKGGSR